MPIPNLMKDQVSLELNTYIKFLRIFQNALGVKQFKILHHQISGVQETLLSFSIIKYLAFNGQNQRLQLFTFNAQKNSIIEISEKSFLENK